MFRILDRASASLFGTLSRIRKKRIFHPRGKGYHATLQFMGDRSTLPQGNLFTHTNPLPAIVRISRGAGLPSPFPDVLGIALRILDIYGPGKHQDFLFCSSGKNIIARRLFIPARTYFARPYCTVLSYKIAHQQLLFSLIPHKPLFHLAIATGTGTWQVIGKLELGSELLPEETRSLRFNPWNTGPDIAPVGFLQRLRKNSYRASQAARARFE